MFRADDSSNLRFVRMKNRRASLEDATIRPVRTKCASAAPIAAILAERAVRATDPDTFPTSASREPAADLAVIQKALAAVRNEPAFETHVRAGERNADPTLIVCTNLAAAASAWASNSVAAAVVGYTAAVGCTDLRLRPAINVAQSFAQFERRGHLSCGVVEAVRDDAPKRRGPAGRGLLDCREHEAGRIAQKGGFVCQQIHEADPERRGVGLSVERGVELARESGLNLALHGGLDRAPQEPVAPIECSAAFHGAMRSDRGHDDLGRRDHRFS